MVVNRGKKCRKARGSRSCGYGPNKNRGAGQRGGRGNAGSGKKCHAKKPSIWGTKSSHLESKGFKLRSAVVSDAINVGDVESHLENWLNNKLISKDGDVFVVDLAKLGYEKLLANGKIAHKLRVTVPLASARAEEKLKSAGCEIQRSEK